MEQSDKAYDAESGAQSQYRPDDHTTSLFITFALFRSMLHTLCVLRHSFQAT